MFRALYLKKLTSAQGRHPLFEVIATAEQETELDFRPLTVRMDAGEWQRLTLPADR